jgi:hypothetical protein
VKEIRGLLHSLLEYAEPTLDILDRLYAEGAKVVAEEGILAEEAAIQAEEDAAQEASKGGLGTIEDGSEESGSDSDESEDSESNQSESDKSEEKLPPITSPVSGKLASMALMSFSKSFEKSPLPPITGVYNLVF